MRTGMFMRTLVKTAKMASAAAIAGLAISLSGTAQAEPSVLQVKETAKSDYAKNWCVSIRRGDGPPIRD